jgi:hypothetical protein
MFYLNFKTEKHGGFISKWACKFISGHLCRSALVLKIEQKYMYM